MRVVYDIDADALTMHLKDGLVAESDEVAPGVIIDFDADGDIVSFEVLDASRRVTDPRRIEFSAAL
jgi:uncharacterized protein YuzE